MTHLDHVDGLDDARSEHTRRSTINEGLHGGPNTSGCGLLRVSHSLVGLKKLVIGSPKGGREGERDGRENRKIIRFSRPELQRLEKEEAI